MTDMNALAERVEAATVLAGRLRGWRSLGDRRSNGDVMCTGCWDRSDHDTDADHDIPAGHSVFWTTPHPEYGDCDAYCFACALDDAECWEIITTAEAAALRARMEAGGC